MFQSPRRHFVSVSLDLFKFFSRFGNLRVCHSICSSFSAASALCECVTRSVQVSQPLRLCVSQSECVTRSSLKITKPVELSVSERISLFRLHFEVEVSYKSLSKRSSSDASSGKIDRRKFSDRLSPPFAKHVMLFPSCAERISYYDVISGNRNEIEFSRREVGTVI